MANKSINIVVSAKDKTGQGFNSASQGAKRLGDGVAKSMKVAGVAIAGLGLAAGALAIGGLAKSVKAAAEFETAMSNVSTLISGDATKAINNLRGGILRLTQSVPQTPDELGASAYDIFSAGITDADDAVMVLAESAKLATAGLGNLEGSTDLMTSAINAFQIETGKANRVSDIIFKTVKSGKTTVDELAQSFGASAPIVASAKISLEEFSAATAALTTTGLPASQSQNSLRQAVVALQKPTQEMKTLLTSLGYESGQAALEQDGLVTVMNKLQVEAGGSAETLGKAYGSVEALTAATALAGPVNEAFTATLADMTEGTNAVDEAFQKQTETFDNTVQILKNKVTAGFIRVGSVVLPILVDLTDKIGEKLTPVIDWLIPRAEQMAIVFSRDIQPAIQNASNWFKNEVIPVIRDVAVWFDEKLKPKLIVLAETMGRLWTETAPVRDLLWELFKNVVIPLTEIGFEGLISALTGITQALSTVFEWINKVTDGLYTLRDVASSVEIRLPNFDDVKSIFAGSGDTGGTIGRGGIRPIAAMAGGGMVSPYGQKPVPIIAHEGEVILNPKIPQQRKILEGGGGLNIGTVNVNSVMDWRIFKRELQMEMATR